MNGKFYKENGPILIAIVILIAAVSIALFISINLSAFLIHYPRQLLKGATRGTLFNNYWRLLLYLQCPWVAHLSLPAIPLTSQAIAHFRTVRQLFIGNELIMIVSSVTVGRYLAKQKQPFQLWRLKGLLEKILLFILATIWLPIINFSTCFIKFHYLLFKRRNWVFNAQKDPIILMMPEHFFMVVFIILVAIIFILILSVIVGLAYRLGFFKFGTDKPDNRRD